MLEVKGELVFKTVAYHRAADAIGRSPVDLVAAYRSGTPPRIPGVGPAISDKIAELATTGHLAFYDRLRAEVPPGLVDAAAASRGSGPRPSASSTSTSGSSRSTTCARPPRPAGCAACAGMSEKTEALVLEGIDRLESTPKRMLLDQAEAIIDGHHRGARGDARRHQPASRPARSGASARRSATWTSSPRPTTRPA